MMRGGMWIHCFHNVFTHNCKTFKMVVYLVEKIINIKNFTIFRSFQTLKRWLSRHRLLLGFYLGFFSGLIKDSTVLKHLFLETCSRIVISLWDSAIWSSSKIFVIFSPACCLSSILSERILLNTNAQRIVLRDLY